MRWLKTSWRSGIGNEPVAVRVSDIAFMLCIARDLNAARVFPLKVLLPGRIIAFSPRAPIIDGGLRV